MDFMIRVHIKQSAMLTRPIAFVFAIILAFLTSCDKSENNGPPIIEFNIAGVEASGLLVNNAGGNPDLRATGSSRELVKGVNEIQHTIVPFDDKLALEVTLTPEGYINNNPNTSQTSSEARSSLQDFGTTRQYLPAGTKYRVVVYKRQSNGTSYRRVFNEVYDVTALTSPSPRQIILSEAGVHRFIVYSVGSTSTVPDRPQNEWWHIDSDPQPVLPWNPSHASSRIYGDQDFMCYTQDIDVTSGINNIEVVLNNMFSQITTTINTSNIGNITNVTADISPHHQNPTIIFSHSNGDATINYGTSDGTPLSFQNLPSTSIETPPTIVCNNGINPSLINFSSITINGHTKGNFSVPVELRPGRRYILKLNVTSFTPDEITLGIEAGGLLWAPGNVFYDGTTYGFVEHQYSLGSFWRWNWDIPLATNGSDFGDVTSGQMGTYTASKDPCNKITGESGWRTPTLTDLNALFATPHVGGAYEGVNGRFFGTSNLGQAQTNPNNYVFLPVAGRITDSSGLKDTGNGYYWTQIKTANNWGAHHFPFNVSWLPSPNNQELNIVSGIQIRCVRTP